MFDVEIASCSMFIMHFFDQSENSMELTQPMRGLSMSYFKQLENQATQQKLNEMF